MIDGDFLVTIDHLYEGASLEKIQAAEQTMNCVFPTDYIELLQLSNGLGINNLSGDSITLFAERLKHRRGSLVIYSLDKLIERNKAYEVARYEPELLLIGNDTFGRGLFLYKNTLSKVYIIKLKTLSQTGKWRLILASSLSDWLKNNLSLEPIPLSIRTYKLDVYITKRPPNGAKGIFQMRKNLQLPLKISEFYKNLKNLPYKALSNVPLISYVTLYSTSYDEAGGCLAFYQAGTLNLVPPDIIDNALRKPTWWWK